MNILTITTLYPNREMPGHGVFVETRLRNLVATGKVSARVVAPVPWFPFKNERFGGYGRFARVPFRETRHGLEVHHPRYPVIPKIGMNLAPHLMYWGLRSFIKDLCAEATDFDLIDAHYLYPDGVAAARFARDLGKPFVVTARGSDVNEIANYAGPRRQILRAVQEAAAVITVCKALKDRLVELGADASHIHVFRNGVDLELFQPKDRTQFHDDLNAHGSLLVSVGHLIPRKGHDLVIRSLAELPDTNLLVVGEGPERSSLERLAAGLGLADRVRFLGHVPQADLPDIYSAADALVLASSREGWANVLLEAMACGTPVVATDVWGTKEVVSDPAAGKLVSERSPGAIAAAVQSLLGSPTSHAATRAHAERFSWQETNENQLRLFKSVAARGFAGSR